MVLYNSYSVAVNVARINDIMIQHRGKTPWRTRLWLLALVAGVIVSVAALGGSLKVAAIESFQNPLLPPNVGVFSPPIPSCTPPNESSSCNLVTGETKDGSLTVKGNLTVGDSYKLSIGTEGMDPASQFCLNPPANRSTIYCIKSWAEIAKPYLKLFSGNTSDDVITNTNTGFARLQAGQNQQFALQGLSGTAAAGRMRAGVAGITSNSTDGLSSGVTGQVPGANDGEKSAFAAFFDGGINGQVAMRVVDGKLTVGSELSPQEICLYGGGEPDKNCINRWSNEVVNYRDPGSGYLLLQSRDALKPPITSQWGMVRVAGHASFTSVVVGTPSGQPVCGDGICSSSEDVDSCNKDCPGISGLAYSNVTCSGNPITCSAVVSWQTNPETTTSASYSRSNIVFDQQAPSSEALTLGHTIPLTGLSSSATYNVRVMGVTASGAALSSEISFSTSP